MCFSVSFSWHPCWYEYSSKCKSSEKVAFGMLGFFKMFMENGFRRSIYFSTEMLKLMHMGKPSKSWWETCYETLHMDFRNSFYFPASFLSTPVYCGFWWGSSLVHVGYLWGKREEWKNLAFSFWKCSRKAVHLGASNLSILQPHFLYNRKKQKQQLFPA